MYITYDEYRTLGGRLGELDFLSNVKKAVAYVNKLASIYTVTYADENIQFALAELTDTFQAEINAESESVSISIGSYSKKTSNKKDVNYEVKRYEIASRYLEISRVAKRW